MTIPKTELKRYKIWLSNGRGNDLHNVISYLQQQSNMAKLFGAYDNDGVKFYYAKVKGKIHELEDIADQFIEGARC